MLDSMLFKTILKHSFDFPVKVNYADGSSKQYGGDGTPEAVITFRDNISVKELIKNPSVCLGEAYMDGIIDQFLNRDIITEGNHCFGSSIATVLFA